MLEATFSPTMQLAEARSQSERADAVTKIERAAVAVIVVALIALRIAYAFVYRLDSDEPQHLHVVWGWANGLLQYRDLFDNHAPLFQMLCAPLFKMFGERADIIVPMRLAMIPLVLFDLWCVYKVASRLWSMRAGLWAAALTGAFPTFFFVSAEFRTDDLWVALWLLALVIATGGEFKGRRAFWFGVVLGATFAVSMKTSVLLAVLVIATVAVLVLRWRAGERFEPRQIAVTAALVLGGMLIMPGALVAFFAAKGALLDMYHCGIRHNMAVGERKLHKFHFKQIAFPLSIPILVALAHFILRARKTDRMAASRQALILITGGLYITALRAY